MMVSRSSKRLWERCSSSSRDWASLPEDLLVLIFHWLIQRSDYLRFGAVCKAWHAVSEHQKVHRRSSIVDKQEIPMLLIPPPPAKTAEEADYHCRRLYSITRKKVLPNLELRVPYPWRCCGSSYGWLATAYDEADGGGITLHNPFSGKSFCFPMLTDQFCFKLPEYEYDVDKVVLSHDPSLVANNDFVVLAIFGVRKRLAYIKPGDNHWTYLPKVPLSDLTDVINHHGKFYVVDSYSGIYSVDISSYSEPRVEEVASCTPTKAENAYLIKSCEGDLLLVQRFIVDRGNQRVTSCFKIFKLLGLNPNGSDGHIVEKVEIYSIGDNTLFLGDNHSLSVSSSYFPGCRPNCIYYTDGCYVDGSLPNYPSGPRDAGIYCLQDRSFMSHYQDTTKQKKRVPIPPPIWIVPPLLL